MCPIHWEGSGKFFIQTSPYILNCFIVCICIFLLILSYTYNLAFTYAFVDESVFIFAHKRI